MRSFFLKIFLWFWLAMALAGIALYTCTLALRDTPPARRWTEISGEPFGIYAQTAATFYEREDASALQSYLDDLERRLDIRCYFYSKGGILLSVPPAPPAVSALAERAFREENARTNPFSLQLGSARRVTSAQGREYVLVGEAPLLAQGFLTKILPRALLVLAVYGVSCWWLASNVASPVLRLRSATRQLATGDLTVRIGSQMGARRDELGALGRDFDVMAARLEGLALAQRRLLGDISHELRSPLTRMTLALELARQRAAPEAGTALDRIEREVGALNTLIGQLLTLHRLEQTQDGQPRRRVELTRLVREVVADADFEARSRNRAVQMTESDECALLGTPELLHSAVENVVRNAVRHTAEKTTVEVAVSLRESSGASQAVITVRDYGEGVPEEDLQAIFQPFFRVADARDRRSGGVGLGLSIAERAVRLHHGSIRAVNEKAGGLRVEISLPMPS